MPAPRSRRIAAAGALAALLVVCLFAALRSQGGQAVTRGESSPTIAREPVDETLSVPGAPEREARAQARVAAAPVEEERAPLRDDRLVMALHDVGAAYRAGEFEQLELVLEKVLADPDAMAALLDLWRNEALRADGEAALGAMIVLETALAYFGRHEDVDPLQARSFVRSILHALPEIPEPERSEAVERMVAAEYGGRPILDARFLRDVLDLRLAWPELRGELGLLLTNLGRGLEGEAGLELFYSVLANEQDDPLAVTIALSTLLETGSETFLTLAEQMFRESQDPELRAAVVRAVVTSLPVERAAQAFTDLAGPRSWADAWSLGAREGGVEALRLAYERELASGGQNAKGREMLVAGMASASAEQMLRIAGSDPDVTVRGQAWLTLTSNSQVDADAMAALTDALRAGEVGAGLLPGQVVSVAANVLSSGTASARAAARALLLEIAGDSAAGTRERRSAAQALETHAPGSLPVELHGLLQGD